MLFMCSLCTAHGAWLCQRHPGVWAQCWQHRTQHGDGRQLHMAAGGHADLCCLEACARSALPTCPAVFTDGRAATQSAGTWRCGVSSVQGRALVELLIFTLQLSILATMYSIIGQW